MKRGLLISAITLLAFGACEQSVERVSDDDGHFVIVTTTGMISDAVRMIVGDSATVETLMGPGVDPHLYKATKGDVERLDNADLILYNGLHLEGKMQDVFTQMNAVTPVVAVGDAVPEERRLASATYAGKYDPHIWFDLSRWRLAVVAMSEAIATADPQRSTYYYENTNRYLDSLDALHEWVRGEIATIPEAQRVLVTAHDAFGYFGDAYDIEVRGLQGISTVAEVGLQDVTNMVDFLVERGVKAVFVETSISPKAVEAVVTDARDKGHEVTVGGELYSDALGAPGTSTGSLLGAMRANVTAIVTALR